MNNVAADNLSREKIQQLLCAIGSKKAEDGTQLEAAGYDWRQPHYFNRTELNRLQSLTKKLAAAVAEKLAFVLHSDFDVSITDTTQHFASRLLDQITSSEKSDYYLAFGPHQESPPTPSEDKSDRGLIIIPPQTALNLVTQLLGDSVSEIDPDKALSQLEESLLLDIGSAIVDVLSTFLSGYQNLKPAKSITLDRLPIDLQGVQEFCKITFSISQTSSEKTCEAQLLAPCKILAPLVGKVIQTDSESIPKDTAKTMLSHVQKMRVCITAQLASTMLTFEQITNLRPGDILLLDKRVNEPIELIMDGRVFFRAQPAKSTGQYAAAITESTGHNQTQIQP